MRSSITQLFCVAAIINVVCAQATFALNGTYTAVSNGLDAAPLGLSFEFFAFPEYVLNVSTSSGCLNNLATVAGTSAPIRIGGTTQDRALYSSALTVPVNYTVASPLDAPDSLTYGPTFFDLAAKLGGEVTLGLNRQLNQIDNTIEAITKAGSSMSNLFAFELGNEPDLYAAGSPIAVNGAWTPALDRASQLSWQKQISEALDGASNFTQAGVYLTPPTWSIAGLALQEVQADEAKYVASFSGHSYPQSACGGAITNLTALMNHEGIVEYVKQYAPEAVAAASAGKPYFIGETNSATCGGGGISPQFGAALWIVDYTMQLILTGAKRLYFHQGTIGNCPYCFWTPTTIAAPYYGAYFAALVLSPPATYIAEMDSGISSLAAYAILNAAKEPIRVLLYNSVFYDGSGTRPSSNITLESINATSVSARSLTAASATSEVDDGEVPTVAGLQFANGTCEAVISGGTATSVKVSRGTALVEVGASEAILLTW